MNRFPVMSRGAVEAYDHLSVPVWVFSVETLGILSANPAARDWLGYDGQTLQDMTIADLRPGPDRAGTIDQVRRFEGTQADAGPWIIVARSGHRYTAAFTWSKILFEGAEAIVVSLRDATPMARADIGASHRADGRETATGFVRGITAIETTEEDLLRQARRRRFAGRLTRLGSWRVDLVGTHICWDAETAAIHDEPEGTSPTPEQALAYYIPEHRDRICAQFEACINEGHLIDDTYQIRTARGRLVWVHALGEPVHDENGNIVAIEGAFQDITDRITAQDAASKLSARLRRTLEGMSDAFYLLDREWRFVFLNTKAESLLKRPRHELLERIAWDEFPEAAENVRRQYERALSENRSVRFEAYYPPLESWFEINADPTPAGLAVYFRDVTLQRGRDTQLRLLETAVSRQNDILLITEAAPVGGPDGPRIVYVNDAFERRTGFTRDEVIGRTPHLLQGPKTDRAELDRIRHALENWQPVQSELVNYTKSGEAFWLEIDIMPLADETGELTHWIAVERDITARKQADLVRHANEERFRLVTRATGSAIWDWDLTTDQDWWSEGFQEIFGHRPDLSGSEPTVWRRHVHPDDLARVDAACKRLLSGQDTTLRERYRFRRADGSWATVEDNAFALHDEDGKLRRALGSMTDISERTMLEERLRETQKLETVCQMTGGVAHDFNNLLTIILGNAEILEDKLSDLPHLQRLAGMSLDAAERGAELNKRLLAFSRRQPLEPQVLDVARLVQATESLLRGALPETIDIEIVRAGGLWKIEADAAQLEAALLNLAVNARDAMPDGGNLTIEVGNAMLDDDYVATEPDVSAGQYVVIVVTDTGQGIAPDMISRVFEPFFTTKTAGRGSGLGLSMVFGFVKQSGGHIRIYSELDEGTSVKVYFPRSAAGQDHVATAHAEREVTGGTETVLVVEDADPVREYVSAQLQGLGYHVLQASAGHEAMNILTRTPGIDLLFTDVVMPGGMGGRELADAARETRPGLKVLFTSGYTEDSMIHDGRLDPGVVLLSKPYRRDQLAAKVRQVLENPEHGDGVAG